MNIYNIYENIIDNTDGLPNPDKIAVASGITFSVCLDNAAGAVNLS